MAHRQKHDSHQFQVRPTQSLLAVVVLVELMRLVIVPRMVRQVLTLCSEVSLRQVVAVVAAIPMPLVRVVTVVAVAARAATMAVLAVLAQQIKVSQDKRLGLLAQVVAVVVRQKQVELMPTVSVAMVFHRQ